MRRPRAIVGRNKATKTSPWHLNYFPSHSVIISLTSLSVIVSITVFFKPLLSDSFSSFSVFLSRFCYLRLVDINDLCFAFKYRNLKYAIDYTIVYNPTKIKPLANEALSQHLTLCAPMQFGACLILLEDFQRWRLDRRAAPKSHPILPSETAHDSQVWHDVWKRALDWLVDLE